MKRLLPLVLLLLLAARTPVAGQTAADSSGVFDSLLERYYAALMYEDDSVKFAEMDWIIGSIADSALRSDVAAKVFRHYRESPLMGEEVVALHVWDRWYKDSTVVFADTAESFEAWLFETFERRSMLFAQAPVMKLRTPAGRLRQVPAKGRLSVLFFYDTGCSKCKAMSILLPHVMEDWHLPSAADGQITASVFAVYTGLDKKKWAEFRKSFSIANPEVEVVHLWDPKVRSDYQMNYGVYVTPRLFAVSDTGMIIGRRLEVESLRQILKLLL